MADSYYLRYREALYERVSLDNWNDCFAITFTMKQFLHALHDGYTFRQSLTQYAATQNMRHFLNKLDKAVFGNAASRYGKRVFCLPVLEGGRDKHLHYHAVIDCPRPELSGDYPTLLTELWLSTGWGDQQIDCQRGADTGWLTYITKRRDKPNLADAIDWTNVRLP